MKITNKGGLPGVIVAMAQADVEKHAPKDGTISVTELVSSPRIYQLKKRHWNDMTQDVDDMIDMLLGTAWHKALEGHKGEHEIAEHRFHCDTKPLKLSGQIDLYDPKTKTITDHKTAKVFSYILGDHKDYEQQLNCYRYLLEMNNMDVEHIDIFWTLKDWSWRKVAQDPDYPKTRALTQPIPLWSMADTHKFIQERLDLHHAQGKTPDDGLPECTPEDMWEREPTFAVKKSGVKTAKRVLSSMDAARGWVAEQKSITGLSIEERPGERVKCEQFCVLSKNGLCSQHKKYLDEK